MSKKKKTTEGTEAKSRYDFSHGRRCPRCKADDNDTFARSTQGGVQYRQCRRAICRHKYTVLGKEIKMIDDL
jgi:Zn ribbon nucleic-acid-binding protein